MDKKSRSKSVKKATSPKKAAPKPSPVKRASRSKSTVKKEKSAPVPKVAVKAVESRRGRERSSRKGKTAAAAEASVSPDKMSGARPMFSALVPKPDPKQKSPIKVSFGFGFPTAPVIAEPVASKPKSVSKAKTLASRSPTKSNKSSPMKSVSPAKKSPTKKSASPVKTMRISRSKTVEK